LKSRNECSKTLPQTSGDGNRTTIELSDKTLESNIYCDEAYIEFEKPNGRDSISVIQVIREMERKKWCPICNSEMELETNPDALTLYTFYCTKCGYKS